MAVVIRAYISYMDPKTLGTCMDQGAVLGWTKQAMFWQWNQASLASLSAVECGRKGCSQAEQD